jgi:Ca-activated chloride channel family protein
VIVAGFSNPLWLLGLFILPIILAGYYYAMKRKRQDALLFSQVSFVKSAMGSKAGLRRGQILFLLSLLAIGLLFTGLAVPHLPLTQTREGVNVVLAIDDSGSMQAIDYAPTRLEAAKSAADILIRNLDPHDYAGVIVFESGATTAAYLSPDKEKVRLKLAAIAPRAGQTAIGEGLALALDMARSIPNKRDVIVLLSDGVNNAGVVTPGEAVVSAQAAGIPVFVVGLGSAKPVILGYDFTGNPKYADIDETALRSIAEQTGGKYFRAVDDKTLSEIYAGLNTEIVHEPEETDIKDAFILAALVLIGIGLWLRYGGRGRIIP